MVVRPGISDYFCLERKFLVLNLISRNLKVRYRKSYFGMLWTVLIPAGSAVIYYFIFSFVLKVNVPNHLLFILCGLIPWTFFQSTLLTGLESLVGNANLLNKVPLPPTSLPLAEALTCFLNLLLSLPVILLVMLLTGTMPHWTAVQYPILLGFLFLTGYSLALLSGLLFVYFRDLRYVLNLVLQFWFYLTPIMYTAEMIPEKARFALYLNPVGILFTGLGESMTQQRWLSPAEWTVTIAWSLGLSLVAYKTAVVLRTSVAEDI